MTNKVKNSVTKTAREIPIIAWAVEVNGGIEPSNIFETRSTARWIRNASLIEYEEDAKLHVRKIAIQVIPGR